MGLFDTVRFDYPLPVPGLEGRTFQTKSFEYPYHDAYRVRPDGQLVVTPLEEVPPEERDEAGYPLLRRSPQEVPVEWTGELVFYDFYEERVPTPEEKAAAPWRALVPVGWVEIRALVWKGVVKEVEVVTLRTTDEPAGRPSEEGTMPG